MGVNYRYNKEEMDYIIANYNETKEDFIKNYPVAGKSVPMLLRKKRYEQKRRSENHSIVKSRQYKGDKKYTNIFTMWGSERSPNVEDRLYPSTGEYGGLYDVVRRPTTGGNVK
jgi:hypothetical protein